MAVGGPGVRPPYFGSSSNPSPVSTRDRSRQRDVGFIGEIGNVLGDILHNIRTSQQFGTMMDVFNPAMAAIVAPQSGSRAAAGVGADVFSTGSEWMGRAFEEGGDFLFGEGEPTPPTSPEQARMQGMDRVQMLLDQSQAILPQFEAISQLEGAPLDAQSQIAVDQLRDQLEQQALTLQQGLTDAQQDMAMQNEMFNAWETAVFGQEGLIPGVSQQEAARLNQALDMGGENTGIGPAVMEAVTAIMNSDLNGSAKMQRIDFILDQQAVQQEARVGINDYTQNLTDIESLEEFTDVELLINQGLEPSYVQPAFNLDLAADPVERQVSAVVPYVDELFDAKGVSLNQEQMEGFTSFLGSIGSQPDFENPALQAQIDNMAKMAGVDPTELQDAIKNGSKAAFAREQAWQGAVTQKRLEPGSEAMAIAVYQTALDKGFPEELAQQIAESVPLHALIKAKSDGKAGQSRGGSQMGIGGLSEAAYLRLGYDPKEIKGNMQMEISALLDYIVQNFGGDPAQALSYFYGTGEWGN